MELELQAWTIDFTLGVTNLVDGWFLSCEAQGKGVLDTHSDWRWRRIREASILEKKSTNPAVKRRSFGTVNKCYSSQICGGCDGAVFKEF